MDYGANYDPRKDALFDGMPAKVTANAKLLNSIIWNNNIQPDNNALHRFLSDLTRTTLQEFKDLVTAGKQAPVAFVEMQQKLQY